MNMASKVALIAKPLAIAAVLTCAYTSAQAQSNVTIYGRITEGINYQSKQPVTTTSNGSQWGVDGGVWGTSMFGVKGTEDLGGGLESSFDGRSGWQRRYAENRSRSVVAK